ncbi:MAG: hypothetical protein JWP88_1883 [Flaviaesturariibacter sp.]|nr:hypothetical protein [Flaviaesturariibacter sp.]
MQKFMVVLLVATGLTACQENAGTPGQKLDTLLKKADTTADQFIDSSRSKLNRLKDKVNNIDIHIGRDSAKKDTSKH